MPETKINKLENLITLFSTENKNNTDMTDHVALIELGLTALSVMENNLEEEMQVALFLHSLPGEAEFVPFMASA